MSYTKKDLNAVKRITQSYHNTVVPETQFALHEGNIVSVNYAIHLTSAIIESMEVYPVYHKELEESKNLLSRLEKRKASMEG